MTAAERSAVARFKRKVRGAGVSVDALRDGLDAVAAELGCGDGPALSQPKNTDVHLTCGPADHCSPTRCAHDRAHGRVGADGFLVSGAAVPSAVPRRYPPNCMTSQGVSHDSALDEWYLRCQRLAGVPGIGVESVRSTARVTAAAIEAFARRYGYKRLRDVVCRPGGAGGER